MRKNDMILAGGILLVSLCLLFFRYFSDDAGENAQVIVMIDGSKYGSYSLSEDQRIDINGTNLLVIEQGSARIDEADCPDQICVKHTRISRDGESIICLPNKLVVTIEHGEEPEIDGIVR